MENFQNQNVLFNDTTLILMYNALTLNIKSTSTTTGSFTNDEGKQH